VVARDDVVRAREVIGTRLHRTPTLSSETLSRLVGARVQLKAELFQRTGSFKPRGVLVKLASLGAAERAAGVIGISAGNHAQALAWAAREEGLSALVVMWDGANPTKIAATRGYGAEVDLEAADSAGAFDRLAELRGQTGRVLVHPFDDPVVIAGQGTVGLELAEEAPGLSVVVVPGGGGGLVAGIAAALPGIRVVAVEPELSTALRSGLEAGGPMPVEPRSVADGLSAPFAGAEALAVCRANGVESVLVSEAEIGDGFRFLYERAKLACEPAAAVGVAALLAGKIPLQTDDTVGVVVSGGNADARIASGILLGP
jgi:threonine dehydratase